MPIFFNEQRRHLPVKIHIDKTARALNLTAADLRLKRAVIFIDEFLDGFFKKLVCEDVFLLMDNGKNGCFAADRILHPSLQHKNMARAAIFLRAEMQNELFPRATARSIVKLQRFFRRQLFVYDILKLGQCPYAFCHYNSLISVCTSLKNRDRWR